MAEDEARRVLVESGVLPETMPDNFTFNKVREILGELDKSELGRVREGIEAAGRLGIRGALQSVIFIKHHLGGEHKVEVDRVDEGEGGARFAVLVYPEGEVPLSTDSLSPHIGVVGRRLRYDPSEGRYS